MRIDLDTLGYFFGLEYPFGPILLIQMFFLLAVPLPSVHDTRAISFANALLHLIEQVHFRSAVSTGMVRVGCRRQSGEVAEVENDQH